MAYFNANVFGNGNMAQFGQALQAGDGVSFGGAVRVATDLVSANAMQRGPVYNGPGANRAGSFSLLKLSRSQKEAVQRAKKYAMEQGIKTVLLKQTIAHQHQQMLNVQQSIQRQQALALMCRVYVGTINFAIKEDTVKQAFLPFGPIKSISLPYDSVLKKHKGFAFIEYEIPEAASLALEQMNGVMICGFSIKVGRPSNMPQAQPIIERLMEEAKSYNRIYVASIHVDLSEPDVRSVFEAFGQIVSCKLATEPTRPGKHKGYGFIEYKTSEAVQDAITGMNLFDLGGQYLRVGRCVTPPNAANQVQITPSSLPTASAIAAAAITAKLNAMDAVAMPVAPMTAIMQPTVITPPNTLGMSLPQVQPAHISGFSPALLTPAQLGVNNLIGTGFSPAVPSIVMPSAAVVQTSQISFTPATIPVLDSQVPVTAISTTSISTDNPPTEATEQQESVVIPETQHEVTQQEVTQQEPNSNESTVMVLKNMVGPEDVDDELELEVKEECLKYGTVNRVIIHNEQPDVNDDATVVKVFVCFANHSETEAAVSAFNGRFFGGRSIIAELYDQQLYNANDLSA